MPFIRLHLRIIGFCYLLLSLPYTALALDAALKTSAGPLPLKTLGQDDTSDIALPQSPDSVLRNMVVEHSRSPDEMSDQQSAVDATSGDESQSSFSTMRRLSSYMTVEALGALLLAEIGLVGACVVVIPGCGTFVGNNARAFRTAYHNARWPRRDVTQIKGGDVSSR
jgi:hypothetical protein